MSHDTTTGDALQGGKRLSDTRFPWKHKKSKTLLIAHLYNVAGYEEYANRAAACAAWLQFAVVRKDGREVRDLSAANFCQLRLCPMCTARRARRASQLLSRVLDTAQHEYQGLQFVFLTLTMRNVQGPDLRDALALLGKAWYRLQDQRKVERAYKGWFRAIEITRNRQEQTFHPHIHAILAVGPEYFSRDSITYITQKEWIDRWKKALRVDYEPSVRIQATRGKEKKSSGQAAANEAAKYATKDAEIIGKNITEDEAVSVLVTYTEALRRKRLTAFGGILKDIAARLKADNLEEGDLVHTDDDEIREDIADLMENYGWNFGCKDYVLLNTSRPD